MAYCRFYLSVAWIILSLVLSAVVFAIFNNEFYVIKFVYWVRDNSTIVSIASRLLSGILAKGQTYVAESVIVFATNSHLLSNYLTKRPINLDNLKLRQAMRERSLIFERGNLSRSARSLSWLLLWQVPAVLWVGSITPVVRRVANPGIQISVPVASYSGESYGLWATECPPERHCNVGSVVKLKGVTNDEGVFSYVPWRTATGLLINAISQASSQDSSVPRHQKLDNTGYTYLGRSYGVAASVGLTDLRIRGTADEMNIPINLIRSYFYYEYGYKASVKCIKNDTNGLYFSKLDSVTTFSKDDAPQDNAPRAYWAGGSLPNGEWKGFPTWGISNFDYVTALAAVIDQDKYMYGFLAGEQYSELKDAQCEVTFTPARFNISVDIDTKEVTVTPVAPPDGKLPADIDINPSRDVVNNTFLGVSYLSQTSTTLYTSVIGDAFYHNLDNVRKSHGRGVAVLDDAINAIEEGLELLLDSFLGNVGAAQLLVSNDSILADGKVVTLEAVQIGNTYLATALLSFICVIFVGTMLELGYLCRRYSISWETFSDRDFLDYKSAIVGVTKSAGSNIQAVENWKGDSEDKMVGELEVTTVDNIGLKLGNKPDASSNTSSSSLAPQA